MGGDQKDRLERANEQQKLSSSFYLRAGAPGLRGRDRRSTEPVDFLSPLRHGKHMQYNLI